jgi:hypothetical protein
MMIQNSKNATAARNVHPIALIWDFVMPCLPPDILADGNRLERRWRSEEYLDQDHDDDHEQDIAQQGAAARGIAAGLPTGMAL